MAATAVGCNFREDFLVVLVGSLFSGIGGFDLGLDRAGMTVSWQVEIDRQCRSVLRRHFYDAGVREDVTVEGKATLTPVDLVCGGFPCQDLSVAGRRAGLAGERSGLFFEFARIVGELRPSWVLIENVPGLLSSWSGDSPSSLDMRPGPGRELVLEERSDMDVVTRGLAELGYRWAYRIVDAQYLGVAQRRRRVFIVGHLGDGRGPEVLFDAASLSRNPPARGEAGAGVAGTLEARAATGGYDPGAHGAASGHIVAHTLSSEGADASEDGTGRGTPIVTAFNWQSGGDCRINPVEERTDGLHVGQTPAVAFTERGRDGGANLETSEELAYTLTNPGKGGRTNNRQILADAPRRLTPRECERLQGFPDDWTAEGADGPVSDSARYRMLGNAVAVPVAEWIGRRLMKLFEEDG